MNRIPPAFAVTPLTSHTRNTTEHRSRSDHRVQTGGNTVVRIITFAIKYPQMRIPESELLHTNAHDTAGDAAQTQTRYKQAARNFHTECEYSGD